MISAPQAIALGILQGLAEFLPVSSSAHLLLAPWLLGFPDPGLTFDVALHLGTLLALIGYFFRDWTDLVAAGFGRGAAAPRRMLWFIAVASIPGAAAGVLLERQAEDAFRSPLLAAATLAVGGALLLLADRYGRRRKAQGALTLADAVAVGSAQALAIIPGFSRSGTTIAAARALGYDRQAAARLSFLLAAPITAGAALYGLRDLRPADLTPPFFLGVAAAALVGLAAIHFLLRYVSRASYAPFVWYRFALAAFTVAVYFLR